MISWLSRYLPAFGLLALAAVFLQYRSSSADYLGRWSRGWLVVMTATWLLTIVALIRAAKRPSATRPETPSPSAFLACAFGLWALVYAAEAWIQSNNEYIARWSDGQFFIAVTSLGVVAEWVVLMLAFTAVFYSASLLASRIPAGMPRLKLVLKRGLLTIGSAVFAFLLLEGAFRARNIVSPRTTIIAKGQSSRMFFWRHYRRNALGFRGKEATQETPSGVYRVICIGDSYTEAQGIRDTADRCTDVLEVELNKTHGDGDIQVMNAGVGATHTVQQIQTLKSLLPYHPDLILLIYCFNDIEHVARAKPRYDHSSLNRLSLWRLFRINTQIGSDIFARLQGLANEDRRDTTPYEDHKTLSAHVTALRTFFDICQAQGVPAALVPFQHRSALGPKYIRRHEILCQAASQAGIQVWRVDHLFEHIPVDELIVNSLDPHPNELAHQLVGIELATRVSDLLERREFLRK